MSESVQSQVDFIEARIREVLNLIDVLKRAVCLAELPQVLSGDLELKTTIQNNKTVSNNHENALVELENYKLKNLHHINH